MHRSLALVVSLAVGTAAIAGVFALDRTLALGSTAHATSNAQIARQTKQLDRYQASLRKALAQKPPPLPPVPASSTAAIPAVTAVSADLLRPAPVRVVYHRPPPVVVTRHHDDEHDAEQAGAEADD